MALDHRIDRAIRDAATAEGQSGKVAQRLIAWLEALHDGNENLGDTAATSRRLTDLFEVAEPTTEE